MLISWHLARHGIDDCRKRLRGVRRNFRGLQEGAPSAGYLESEICLIFEVQGMCKNCSGYRWFKECGAHGSMPLNPKQKPQLRSEAWTGGYQRRLIADSTDSWQFAPA